MLLSSGDERPDVKANNIKNSFFLISKSDIISLQLSIELILYKCIKLSNVKFVFAAL